MYFYNHHTIKTETLKISGFNLDGPETTGVQWKEITFSNKASDDSAVWKPIFSNKQWEFINTLPVPIQNMILLTRSFYHKRYVDSWAVSISGVALKDVFAEREGTSLPRVLIGI